MIDVLYILGGVLFGAGGFYALTIYRITILEKRIEKFENGYHRKIDDIIDTIQQIKIDIEKIKTTLEVRRQ